MKAFPPRYAQAEDRMVKRIDASTKRRNKVSKPIDPDYRRVLVWRSLDWYALQEIQGSGVGC